MRFTKMHGAGNDYVYVNGFEERVEDAPALARRVSDRHTGIGSDGLIIIQPPSAGGHCRMEMYNADGSRGAMCGNGIRCVARYALEHGIASAREIRVETDAGLKSIRVLEGPGGAPGEFEVDMGAPALARAAIPLADGGDHREPAIDIPMPVRGKTLRMTAVSMGNPHAVIRLDRPDGDERGLPSLEDFPLAEWGPSFEHHAWFPRRTNTELIRLRSRGEMDFRVWERGSGETLACGTGACAAVVAAVVNGWCDPEVLVHLRGGDLRIRWEGARSGRSALEQPGSVYMTGPAVEVFSGEWKEG